MSHADALSPLLHACLFMHTSVGCAAQERLARQAEELRRKLAGIHPDGPSREERYQRRLQQIDNGETPSPGEAPPLACC